MNAVLRPALLRPALSMALMFTALLGIAAPLAMTGIASLAMPGKAGGSLIERDGRVIGSALIGQNFTESRYFHPRPSGAGSDGYDASAGAASQLSPTSEKLVEAVRERVAEAVGGTGGGAGAAPVPADMVTTSGSGLDPHISPESAARQVQRVATARNLPEAQVRELLAAQTEAREFGVLGEPRVNVLRLNLTLDALR